MKNFIKPILLFSYFVLLTSCNKENIAPVNSSPDCEKVSINLTDIKNANYYLAENNNGNAISVVENKEITFVLQNLHKVEISNVGWLVNNKNVGSEMTMKTTFSSGTINELKVVYTTPMGQCSKEMTVVAGIFRKISVSIDPIDGVCEQVAVGFTYKNSKFNVEKTPLYFSNSINKICWTAKSTNTIFTNSFDQILSNGASLVYQLDAVKEFRESSDLGGLYHLLLFFTGNGKFITAKPINPRNISSAIFTPQNTNNWSAGTYKIQGYTLTIK